MYLLIWFHGSMVPQWSQWGHGALVVEATGDGSSTLPPLSSVKTPAEEVSTKELELPDAMGGEARAERLEKVYH